MRVMSLVAMVQSLALLIFGIWWAVLLAAYRRRFRDAAEAAEGNWTAGVVAPPPLERQG